MMSSIPSLSCSLDLTVHGSLRWSKSGHSTDSFKGFQGKVSPPPLSVEPVRPLLAFPISFLLFSVTWAGLLGLVWFFSSGFPKASSLCPRLSPSPPLFWHSSCPFFQVTWLFYFGCAESSLWHTAFSSCSMQAWLRHVGS